MKRLMMSAKDLLVRKTTNGPVEGIEQISSLGQKYYAFKGIPFAEPPITGTDPYTGEQVNRRFKAPVPLKRIWKDNLPVKEFGDICIQSGNKNNRIQTRKMSENCLFLNVYVPAGGKSNKTVLVWIHGGGFGLGDTRDNHYGPDFLLFEDNIVVTIQYRLAMFGFLNLGFGEYTGNMGLRDQQLALKWVYENIEHFSGNKNEVLLFGQSAGSVSVSYQMLNEISRKYFNRAFLSSGTALSYKHFSKSNHLQRMKEYTKIDAIDQLIEYLKDADSESLSQCYAVEMNEKKYDFPWVPTIENPEVDDAFITKTPEEIYNSVDAPNMDVMFSFNSKEMLASRPNLIGRTEPIIKKDLDNSELELPFDGFNETSYPKEYRQSLYKLRAAYFPNSDNDTIEGGNIALMSDIIYGDNILKATILQTKANRNVDKGNHKNTFLYRFSVDAGLNSGKIKNNVSFDGASHADDICYYFHCHSLDRHKLYDDHLKRKDATYDVIMRMVKMITNFARTGNPSIENDTPFKPCESEDEIYCQEISNELRSNITTDIEEQVHYRTWGEIETIYKNLPKKLNSTIYDEKTIELKHPERKLS